MPKQLTKVGKYVIVDKMAKGGMGAVYKAKHPTLKRFVILKQLTLRGSAGISERFKREAQLMIDFRHENIVPVYDHFKSGSSYFIVMEFVDGTSLDRLIAEKGQLSSEAALLIFSEICKGLKHAHDKGVIHRDIKPANILLSKQGEVKIVDFGIATTLEPGKEGLTQAGMTLGTPAYMSPEQIADSRSVDKRSDIYSMGVMLYEMLTGEKPFPGDFTADAINRINKGHYKNPKRITSGIPGFLVHIMKKMMHHKAKRRHANLQHVLHRLSKFTRRYRTQASIRNSIKRYLEGSEITAPAGFAIGKTRTAMRPLLKIGIGLVVFLVVVVGGLYSYYQGYLYEYLMRREYGRIEVRALVPRDYYKRVELVYAHTRVTRLDEQPPEDNAGFTRSYRLTPKKTFPFALFPSEEGESGLLLTSGSRYIPAGYYRIDTYLENRKYYSSLYLNPRVIQKEQVKTFEGRILEFRLEEGIEKPIDLTLVVKDSETGESLYGITDIALYLEESDRWVDWKRYRHTDRLWRYLSGQLRSGRSYKCGFTAPGYFKEVIDLYVEPDLDAARIDVSLMKKPGTLLVQSDRGGLEILIDNRRESYTGAKRKEFVRYGSTVVGDREFKLDEGVYVLTVKRGSRTVKNFQFAVTASRTTTVRVSYDDENREIVIR
jgi:serine/threonine-protein kinase